MRKETIKKRMRKFENKMKGDEKEKGEQTSKQWERFECEKGRGRERKGRG